MEAHSGRAGERLAGRARRVLQWLVDTSGATSELGVLAFTLAMAGLATLAILPAGVALGWLLARRRFPLRSVVETVVLLPLVMPPVATGLVLLELLGRRGLVGGPLSRRFGLDVAFTWRAVVVAMAVMSFPLLVRGARMAFEGVSVRLEQVAATLGARPWRVFATVSLPLAARGIVSGAALAFARALGEFGATILVAGAIPGRTVTTSIAIWQHVQLGEDGAAIRLVALSAVAALVAVGASEALSRQRRSGQT